MSAANALGWPFLAPCSPELTERGEQGWLREHNFEGMDAG